MLYSKVVPTDGSVDKKSKRTYDGDDPNNEHLLDEIAGYEQ